MQQGPRGFQGPQCLEEPHGEDDVTAGLGAYTAAPNSGTLIEVVEWPGSTWRGTVARDDDVDTTQIGEVGCQP